MRILAGDVVDRNDQIACVTTYQGSFSLWALSCGFLELARAGTDLAQNGRIAVDTTVPAIIYAVRHSAELFLKHIIADFNETHRLRLESPAHHRLQDIFDGLRPSIENVLMYEREHAEHGKFDSATWLDDCAAIVAELHEIDPDGQSVRYPENLKGKANLNGQANINVTHLGRFIRRVEQCFVEFVERKC